MTNKELLLSILAAWEAAMDDRGRPDGYTDFAHWFEENAVSAIESIRSNTNPPIESS